MSRRERTGLPVVTLPLLLSVVAGLTDVTTFVLLDGMFSAHITGNLVVLAADVATDRPVHLTTLLAVPFFIVAAAVVTALVTRSARPPARWVLSLATTQFLFLAAAGALSVVLDASRHPGAAALAVGLLAVAAMAVQNSLLHLAYRATPSTAVMTGNVVEATISGVRLLTGRAADAAAERAAFRHTWPLIVGFLAGCRFGALACRTLHDWGWVLPVAAALIAVLHARAVAGGAVPLPAALQGPAAAPAAPDTTRSAS